MNTAPMPPTTLRAALQINQLIHLALGLGVVMFLGVVVFLRDGSAPPHPAPVPPLFFAVFAVSAFAAGLTLHRVLLPSTMPPGAGARDADQEACFLEFVRRYQRPMLARAALAEGAALLGSVLLLLEKGSSPASAWYFCAPVAFIALQALTFPTEDRLRGLYASLRRAQVSR